MAQWAALIELPWWLLFEAGGCRRGPILSTSKRLDVVGKWAVMLSC
jgi:hypothetical protein